MSPTVESAAYKADSQTMFKLPSLRRNSFDNDSECSSSGSSSIDSSAGSTINYNNNSSTKPLSPLSNLLNTRVQLARDRSDDVSVESDNRRSATSYLTGLPTTRSGGDSEGRTYPVDGPSFPTGASVSLPTSTTALDYLLHKHGGRDSLIGNAEKEKTLNATKSEDGPSDTDKDAMTKTLSESDASSFLRRRSSAKNPNHVAHQFFHVEPCLYTHRMFQRAAKIFEVLKQDDLETEELRATRRRRGVQVVEKDKIPDMDFIDAQEQIKTFELTFASLKFQTLFHEILEHTGFFSEYSNLRDDYGLVCIILYDLQNRKFQRRTPFPGEELDEVCTEIENAILDKKTRLQSHIAKERIKNNAPSIDYLLPEQVRNKDETKIKTPVYLWVNQMKTTMDDMLEELEAEQFTMLEAGEDISEQEGRVFKVDQHCSDLFIFPPHLDMFFKDTIWVKNGYLVQQDKSSCLAPKSVEYLLGVDQDVIHVNVGTGVTTAHLASLLRKKSSHSHIWGFSNDGPDKVKKAMKNLEFLGAKNTKILFDDFLSVDPEEARFKSVKVIMVTANCSKSAITSPVQFIVSEGEDMRFLGELSKADTGMSNISNLMLEHEKLLKHALRFQKVQAVVYATRSRHEAENEQVVTRVLEYANVFNNNKKVPFKVTPPVLPFTGDEIDSGTSGVDGRFVRFLPSDKSNGCFVAVISREPEDPKDVARFAIARAKTKGLLGKAKSTPQTGDVSESDTREPSATVKTKPSGRKLKASASAPESKTVSGFRSKVAGHKSPAAIGARLYQAGLLSKMEHQAKMKPRRPEHTKVVKHPAPFRG